MSGRCNTCGWVGGGLNKCSRCRKVSYCSRACQQADWKMHKPACTMFQSERRSRPDHDESVPAGQYVGTFRWANQTNFQELPPWTREDVCISEGWQGYLGTRWDPDGGEDEELSTKDSRSSSSSSSAKAGPTDKEKMVIEVSTIDALSFPLTFLYAFRQSLQQSPAEMKDFRTPGRTLIIVALGCSERAEEHVLKHTAYFSEIGHWMPLRRVQLWLVGPEISQASHLQERQLLPNMTANCYKGGSAQFLRDKLPEGTDPGGKVVLMCYNTGMASGDDALRASWAADLRVVLGRGYLAMFTCANDHSDLKGERQVMEQQLLARYVVYPRKNPFSAVTVMHPPGERETGWYCANAYLYAVQGLKGDAQGADDAAPPAAQGRGAGPSGTAAPASDPTIATATAGVAAAATGRGGSGGGGRGTAAAATNAAAAVAARSAGSGSTSSSGGKNSSSCNTTTRAAAAPAAAATTSAAAGTSAAAASPSSARAPAPAENKAPAAPVPVQAPAPSLKAPAQQEAPLHSLSSSSSSSLYDPD